MNAELTLMATLAALGGRWLREGGAAPAPELLTGGSSFQHVSQFTAPLPATGVLRRRSVATSPEEWLRALRRRGTRDLSLVTSLPAPGALPAPVAAAFSNAGPWGLLATGRDAPTLWTIRWEVGSPAAPDSRIWSLTAAGTPAGSLQAPQAGLAEARGRLEAALAEIRAFALSAGLAAWAPSFARAQALLDDPAPTYPRGLLPPDSSLPRRQLLAAAARGWVFGGMGSWNDVGPADPAAQGEHDRVSAGLYSALLAAIPAATNGA